MADISLERIDITTPQPNGKFGENTKSANEKHNRNIGKIEVQINRVDTVVAEVQQVKDDVVQMGNDLREEVDEKVAQIDQTVSSAITQIDQKITDLEEEVPVMVDTAINGRIPGKNRLINGNFDFFQRGNSGNVTSAAPYTADRWICSAAGGATCNWGVGVPSVGEIPWARRFLGFNIVPGTTSAWVGQRIENASTFAGGKATVSFWMRSSVAGKKVGVLIQQVFGSGGSAIVQVDGPVITFGTAFQKYAVTFDVPSVAGKTYGANDNLLLCFFYTDDRPELFGGQLTNQTGLFELAQVQFESGDKATEFDFRPPAYELSLCQRYYEKSYDLGTRPGTAIRDGCVRTGLIGGFFTMMGSVSMKVTKRIAPAVTTYAARSGVVGKLSEVSNTGVYNTERNCNPSSIGQNNFNIGGDAYTANYTGEFHWTADAEL